MRDEKVKISDTDRALLATLPGNPVYESLLNLMEAECVRMETEHFQKGVPEASDAQVRASLAECRAGRKFFERVQFSISAARQEIMGEQAFAEIEKNPPTPEEILSSM